MGKRRTREKEKQEEGRFISSGKICSKRILYFNTALDYFLHADKELSSSY